MNLNIILVGIMVSIIFYEITNISPGGIVVPGLLALYFNQLDRVIYTLIISIITYFIVKLLSKYFIIFGKRRFVFMIIISVVLNLLLDLILPSVSFNMININIVGYTIAGIIANNIYKQGMLKTIPSLVICVAIIEAIVLIVGQVGF